MMELKEIKKIHLSEYDIDVNEYLTLDEIKGIVEGAIKFEDYVERDLYINLAILLNGTSLTKEEVDSLDYNIAEELFNKVNNTILNTYRVYEYIKRYESVEYNVKQFLTEANKMIKSIEKSMPNKSELGNLTELLKGIQ